MNTTGAISRVIRRSGWRNTSTRFSTMPTGAHAISCSACPDADKTRLLLDAALDGPNPHSELLARFRHNRSSGRRQTEKTRTVAQLLKAAHERAQMRRRQAMERAERDQATEEIRRGGGAAGRPPRACGARRERPRAFGPPAAHRDAARGENRASLAGCARPVFSIPSDKSAGPPQSYCKGKFETVPPASSAIR